jgi:hypothetical protein
MSVGNLIEDIPESSHGIFNSRLGNLPALESELSKDSLTATLMSPSTPLTA